MERIARLIPLVKPFYTETSDPAHDWPHIGRVAASAKLLAKNQTLQLECLLAAVYCHDLVNLPKDHPERKNASTLTANRAETFLIEAGFNVQ